MAERAVNLPLKGGDLSSPGGGGVDMLEQRVARLEADMVDVKAELKGLRSDIVDVRTDLSELKGTVKMLPGYPGIAVIMAIVSGAFLLAQRVLEAGIGP